MDRLKRMKDKKEEGKMHPLERKAKMDVMKHLQDMAHDAMGNKLKGMGKVTVASDSPEGLQHGLSKAQDMMDDEDQMMAHGGVVGLNEFPLNNLPVAADDTNHDHENFAHTENEEDGEDGLSAYPDADDGHELEKDPAAQHRKDEKAEGDEDQYAEGGEVTVEDHEDEEQHEEHSEMPNYDDMDRGEMSAHLEQLVAAMRNKGIA